MLYESQEDGTDEDFTPHDQASLETKFLSSGPFVVLYRAMRCQGAGLSCQIGNKKYCPRASVKGGPWYVCVLLNKQALEVWQSEEKEGDVQGHTSGQIGRLKFRRASGQDFEATLHWRSVAMNKRRGWSHWAYVGKHSGKTKTLPYLWKC